MCALLLLVGIACIMFVYIGTYAAGMDRLLEEGDYTRSSKARSHITGKVSTIYWLAVTAIFLFYTFGPNGNGQARYSWFIWAIARRALRRGDRDSEAREPGGEMIN